MANTKKKIKVRSDRISFLYKYRNISQAELARRVYELKTGLIFSEKNNKNYISDFNKLLKRQEMVSHDVEAIAEVLDCHPNYILGVLNEKAEDVLPPHYKLSEEEYIKSINWRHVSHEEYMFMKNMYLIDDEGFYVPPYRKYEYEEKKNLNTQDFRNWLLSINMFDDPDLIVGFPSNKVIESILSDMGEGGMLSFQGHLIECVYDYLTEEGYIQEEDEQNIEIIDYSKLSEAEILRLEEEENRPWIEKQNEGHELLKKRKGESDNGKH